MKIVLIIYVILYNIYFTFESIIFRSYRHWRFKGATKIKRKIRKRQASKDWFSQGVVDRSEGAGSTFVCLSVGPVSMAP